MPSTNHLPKQKQRAISQAVNRRHLLLGGLFTIVLLLSAWFLTRLSPYNPSSTVQYLRATVVGVTTSDAATADQTVYVRVLDGQDKGRVVSVERTYVLGDPNSARLPLGSQVLLLREPANGNQYQFFDRYRIPGAVTIFVILLALVVVVGKWRGITGAVGLVISIGVLVLFVLPRIIAGDAPFATCIEGALLIAALSIYVAHGFSKRTTVALGSIVLTLVIMVGLVMLTVRITGVSGDPGDAVNIEQQTSLLQYATHHIDLAGLLMGGIVIATLGVLEDIATAQAAAIDEIRKANPSLQLRELYRSGMSVGREHVASLINTLVLVYFGAALPTIVLTVIYGSGPVIVMLNNETLMEAVARTGAVSVALLLAVPLSAGLSAYVLPKWHARSSSIPK